MARTKIRFTCNACGAQTSQWMGQCPECQAWNSLTETPVIGAAGARARSVELAGGARGPAPVRDLAEVAPAKEPQVSTGIDEFDRVLGGGLVAGSVVLIGGDPGIGKSTLLLQAAAGLAAADRLHCLYVTGEESPQQVAMRGTRLGVEVRGVRLLAETNVERILSAASRERPGVVVVDSIQTMYTDLLQSAPGSVAQVRESAAQFVRFAKETGAAILMVGHVTKEGALAGPRVLEHMVDAVLYFESERNQRYRAIRAVKNRFGAANELGIFAMTETGLKPVDNPSAIFLSRQDPGVPGSAVTVTQEGTRPLLLEIQALVDGSQLSNPRRVAVGLDSTRLNMQLAVLHRHAGVVTHDQDVYVNVVGGVRIGETGADLALLAAVCSSLRNAPLPSDLVMFGEVGLSGEIRPVQNGEARVAEAAKHGFKRAVLPRANKIRKKPAGMTVVPVSRLEQALDEF
ncbi:MAG: DNA repair protein RadA [Gammaproteobacteria bacterium]|nr:DNA repair protein RadA [Gammaproteobacteria bacterium]